MWRRLFNSQQDPGNLEQLQQRIALYFVFLTFFAILFFGISDYFLDLNPVLNRVRLVYISLFLCFVFIMVRYRKFFLAMNLMLGLILIFTIINYLYNDGYQGPTLTNIFVFVVAVAIFFKKPLNLIWLVASMGSYLLLFYLEVESLIKVSKNYQSPRELFLDNAISIALCTIFIFIGIYLLIINYQKQHRILVDLKKENEIQLAELTALNSKKNELIALLSHDLRGPIGTLNATLDMVDQGILDKEDLSKILSGLKSQSFQLTQVLDNTLAWVISEMQVRETEKPETDIKKLGMLMVDTMGGQALSKNQRMVFELNGPNLVVNLEAKEVKIILKNLLDNAIKFSPVGALIYLSLTTSDDKIRWEVRNTGKLIPEELRTHLFDFGAKSAKGTKNEKGTGIGLSLCKKIADHLGMRLGYLINESNENVFYLEIDLESTKYHS
ncbi:sensor histidine kinase KdpD [Algoriphagus sp. AK58]|uniref:sensor histidine kinase n=1 Tax=Algoriphagus sp. AK58 TaxID=1406877 RepID=UPI0016501E37|nr:HAMP domain-containing sensor histidine kinase [Algoriphagus sp. AK58]MBC6366745.1 hypothetical protein [Algoriphagus sp. AK58]